MMTKPFTSAKKKILFYSEKDRKTGCRNWIGSTNTDGYGRVRWKGKVASAHRLAYESYNGPIPMGTVIHHKCSNTRCVNINHLQAVSHQENSAEMMERQYYLKKIAELEAKVIQLEGGLNEQAEGSGNLA